MTEPVSDSDILSLTEEPDEDDGDGATKVADLGGLARRGEFDHQTAEDDLADDDPTMVGLVDDQSASDDVSDDAPTAVLDRPTKAVVPAPQVIIEPAKNPPAPVQKATWLSSMLAPLMIGVGFGFVVLAYLLLTR